MTVARRERMHVLALAEGDRLAALWDAVGETPAHSFLRGPEFGLVMLRGRVGGTGQAFNVGEVTVTRASVRLEDGAVGHAVALGRDRNKAQLAALIDACCQQPDKAELIEREILVPLRDERAVSDAHLNREAAATRVDFFTMVRGED